MSETITENIFRSFYGATTFTEKSAIPESYGFKSKKGGDCKGYPDFFLMQDKFAIVVEAKATDHEKAKEEVQFYIKNNKIQKDIIGIAITGQNKPLQIDYFLKTEKIVKPLNIKNLISLIELEKFYNNIMLKINYEKMVLISDDINTFFHNNTNCGIPDRPFFFSALIIAMQDKSFDYEKKQSVQQLNDEIFRVVKEKLDNKISNNINKLDATARYSFLKNIKVGNNINNNNIKSKIFEYNIELTDVDNYKNFIKNFFEKYGNFNETLKYYDIIGKAYTNFLRYTKAAGGQDIVLTPEHIKHLMFDIIGVDKDDIILDTCTGSGGFIATGFGKLLKANEDAGINIETGSQKFKDITEKQLVAIEKEPNMYSLAFSNMVLHGDGKSNLYEGNCFTDHEQIIRDLKPTLGIINPPYNDNVSTNFILRLLDLLEKRGKAIIIAPSNCLTQAPEIAQQILDKHTLKAIIKLNGKVFMSQKIGVQTSLYIFETGIPHNESDIYYYTFEDDGYYYTQRIENEGDFEERKQKAIENIAKKIIINGTSYWGKIRYFKMLSDEEKINYYIDNTTNKKKENHIKLHTEYDIDDFNNLKKDEKDKIIKEVFIPLLYNDKTITNFNELQYINQTKEEITNNDFINSILNYAIYELEEAKNG